MMFEPASDAYRARLAAVFLLLCVALAISPVDRGVWAIENVLVVGGLGVIHTYRREVPLTRASCVMIFIFLCIHEIGAHYTYPEVPWNEWTMAVLGISPNESFGFERNNFDRFVHVLFGLLLTLPMREALLATSPMRRGWSYVLPVAVSMAASAAYEVFEWLGVALFAGVNGPGFIGAQNDIWDGQKDMALATLGAILPMLWVAIWERGRARDLVGAGAEPLTSHEGSTRRRAAGRAGSASAPAA
jgi:putative membrane protein